MKCFSRKHSIIQTILEFQLRSYAGDNKSITVFYGRPEKLIWFLQKDTSSIYFNSYQIFESFLHEVYGED